MDNFDYQQILTNFILQKHKINEDIAQKIAVEVVRVFFLDIPESEKHRHAMSFIGELISKGIIRKSEEELVRKIYKETTNYFELISCSIH